MDTHVAKFRQNAADYGHVAPAIVSHQVPARTLDDILRAAGYPEVDFFSLDVEGFELEALRGLDFSRCAPKRILVEDWDMSDVGQLLTDVGYSIEQRIGTKDVLYVRT